MTRSFFILAILALFACGPLPGDRSGSGSCPIGETCSPQAPMGLFFEGQTLSSHLFDIGNHPTAVGGRQLYRIFRSKEREPILVPFTVEIEGEGEVVSTTSTAVTVSATSSGFFRLRVLDLDGDLLDSISLAAKDVASASILPPVVEYLGGPFDNNNEPPLYYEGGTIDLVLSLRSDTGKALVDNQATAGMGTPKRWDLYGDVAVTKMMVEVTAAGADFTAALETASSIDDVSVSNLALERIQIYPNSRVQLCFAAYAGARLVYGAPWTFSLVANGLTLERIISLERCIDLNSNDAPAAGRLTIQAGDRQEDFSIDIVDDKLKPERLGISDEYGERWQPMSGDRATANMRILEQSAP